MCGICGIVSVDPRTPDRHVLMQMCGLIRHRGPDDEGFYLDGHAGLGMRRLSIIDLETGGQPMSNEDGTIWIVYNGEIYNYPDLRVELEKGGHRFRTKSDTEVIIHAYEQWGEKCLQKLLGMFAFAIWELPKRRLFLARDRLGIKPLYYWTDDGQIVFASEMKALIAHPEVPRDVDPVALDQFLTLEYVSAPRTIFQRVRKLPAGHCLAFEKGLCRLESYWDIPRLQVPEDKDECQEALTSLLEDAVRSQLISDVPVGVLLSGGIDSSSVTALMSRQSTGRVRSFSIGFEDPSYNELPSAGLVAAHFGTDHHVEIVRPQIADLADQLIRHLDEPLGDFSIFPTFLVSRMAGNSVKVVLSGDGGDEVFGGYESYLADRADRYYRYLPSGLRRTILPALLSHVHPRPSKKGLVNKAKRFVEGASLPRELQHTRWMIFLTDEDRKSLYQPWLQSSLNGDRPRQIFEELFRRAPRRDPLSMQQYVDLKTYLAENILTKVDRMSMAASIEVRVPLLDHRLVEFAYNLPSGWKLSRGRTKVLLRSVMGKCLPKAVLNKPKQGFSIPLKNWLCGPLRPMMTDLLSGESVRQTGYFQADTILQWTREHLEGRVNHSHRLWALMVFQLWHQNLQKEVPVTT